jgi:hypothetical protein
MARKTTLVRVFGVPDREEAAHLTGTMSRSLVTTSNVTLYKLTITAYARTNLPPLDQLHGEDYLGFIGSYCCLSQSHYNT